MNPVDIYLVFLQVFLPPLLLGLLVYWMLRAPQSLKAAVTRLWDALMAPITGVQNTLALALQSLQERIAALGAAYRSPRVVMGALFCVLAAMFTMPGAAEFLYLTMLGLLGVDAAPLFGAYSGHVMSLSLFVGLAFVFALGLEFMGATHLGLLDDTADAQRESEGFKRRRLMAWLRWRCWLLASWDWCCWVWRVPNWRRARRRCLPRRKRRRCLTRQVQVQSISRCLRTPSRTVRRRCWRRRC